jgi:spermidine synthase
VSKADRTRRRRSDRARRALAKTKTSRRPVKADAAPGSRPLRFPGTLAFIGSGCLLVLEIVAGRMLAPVVGASLYTWTSVIGVVLAGLSIGNYLGGRLADRWPDRTTLSYLYLASALASALILLLSRDLTNVAAPASWSAPLQVLWLTTILFFVPSILLGMVTPLIVKLSLRSLDATGRVVGRIQAAASLGSIVGVFLTGFFLISVLGTRPVVASVAAALLCLAVASNPPWGAQSPQETRASDGVLIGFPVIAIGVAALLLTYNNPCLRESKYYCIQVHPDQSGQYKELLLDPLVNGVVSIQDPTRLVYPYERLYGEIVNATYKRDRPLSAFAIGGGTYTFPRYLEKHHHGNTLVAEIDPEVTDVVRSQFGLHDSPGIRTINEDARPVLRDRPKGERYDLVLGDAFGDIAIPYQLVTREFNELVKSHLKPDGMYLANVVDGVNYDFLRSCMKTLMKTFPYVRLLVSPLARGEQNTFVIVASMRPPAQTRSMASPGRVTDFLRQREAEAVTLTDDHAPVDQLLAPVFRKRLHRHPGEEQVGG